MLDIIMLIADILLGIGATFFLIKGTFEKDHMKSMDYRIQAILAIVIMILGR